MGLLTRTRSRILDTYRHDLKATPFRDVTVRSSPTYHVKPNIFSLKTKTSALDEHAFHISACCISASSLFSADVAVVPVAPFEIRLCEVAADTCRFPFSVEGVPVSLLADATYVSVYLEATYQVRDFSSDWGNTVNIVPVAVFSLQCQRFSFLPPRREMSLFGSPRPKSAPLGSSVARVVPPSRPPVPDSVSLQERLRLLLTPPIHEILSDPQLALPEKPFPFQTKGIKWLFDRTNALLADEMGLGKTMQAIIAARLLWREQSIKDILIICPKSLVPNWKTEMDKWWIAASDSISVCTPTTDRRFFLKLGMANAMIKIINYEAIQREGDWLSEQTFQHDLIIIDEAQRIKNENSTSRAVKSLKSKRRWALTGTPLENRLEDLVSIFEFVHPSLLNDATEFTITESIRPYILRRRTEEVLPQLPEKIEHDVAIELDGEQRAAYEQIEREGVVKLNAMGDTITITHVFQLISKLRQTCNFEIVTGRSAKMERLMGDLEEIAGAKRKALVFSQFVAEDFGLKRIAGELQEANYRSLQFHGQVPQRDRPGIITRFERDDSVSVLLLNYAVGGVGLNLQAANYVYLFDRWWNPAVEDQAVKRAHRLGQTQKVLVSRFYCKDTIEERILLKLAEKRRLFNAIIDENRPAESMGLSEEEIFSLFNITVRPRKMQPQQAIPTLILDNMDFSQFEVLVADLYKKQGYEVSLTSRSHDGGIDVVAEKQNIGGNERIVVQCKHQKNTIGRPVLQQLWGVISADQNVTRGVLVTSSTFSREAQEFAEGKRLTLIDRLLLEELIRKHSVANLTQEVK